MNKNDRALWVARLLLCAASVLAAACGSDTPGAATAPPPTYPNVSGTWQGTVVEAVGQRRTFTATLTLTQQAGSTNITGTVETRYDNSRFTETITTGTQSGLNITLQTELRDSQGNAVHYSYQGRMDSNGAEIDGTVAIPPGVGSIATWRVRR